MDDWTLDPGAGPRLEREAADVVLDVRDLTVRFERDDGYFEPVSGLNLQVRRGQTLGVVGESGSGKSMTGLAIMGMLPAGGKVTSGTVDLAGRDLLQLSQRQLRGVRGNEIAMIFQDSMTSLNPTKTIGEQVAEPVRLHRGGSRRVALERAKEVLSLVGIPRPAERLGDYPHQLSGGMRQRVMIAMALACEPKVVIADEPTTALDVTIQAQVLAVLDDLKTRLGMGIILITHDIGVIAGRADRVSVMYAGKTAELSDTDQLFHRARHRYTRDLLASIPLLTQDRSVELYSIGGAPPDLTDPPAGCRYAPRCQAATKQCTSEQPPTLIDEPGHEYACWHPAQDDRLAAGTPAIASTSGVGARREAEPTTSDAESPVVPVLQLVDVVKEYPVRAGIFGKSNQRVHAVSGINLQLHSRETYGLVGESGCGKTTLGRTIVGLEKVTGGSVLFRGADISTERERRRAGARRAVQMMFQDPYGSLDPRMKIATILQEPLKVAGEASRSERQQRVTQMLDLVGLPTAVLTRLPHELSGGQRQRVGLARALILDPQVLVADEPVSALDVSIRSQVLNLMRRSSAELDLSMLVISHDLAVVKYLADRIGVMYLGKLVEEGAGDDIYTRPAHPYTAGLIAAIPEPDPDVERSKPPAGVMGELPSAVTPPSGCRFRTRCPLATEKCATIEPALQQIGPGHQVACHYPLATDTQRRQAVLVSADGVRPVSSSVQTKIASGRPSTMTTTPPTQQL